MTIEELKEIIKHQILVANEKKLDPFINDLTHDCDLLYHSGKFRELKTRLAKHKLKIRGQPINLLLKNAERTEGFEFLCFLKHPDNSIESGGKLFAAAEELSPKYVKALDIVALWEVLACLTNRVLDNDDKLKPVRYYHINVSKELLEEEDQMNLLIVLTCLQDYITNTLGGVLVLEMSEQLTNIHQDISNIKRLANNLKMAGRSFFAWDDTFYIENKMSRVPLIYHLEFYSQTKFIKIDYKFFQELYKQATTFTSTFSNLLMIDQHFLRGKQENLLIFEGVETAAHKAMLRNHLADKCLIQGLDVHFS